MLDWVTPTCSATSATDRPRFTRASRRWRLKLGLRGNDMLLICWKREHNRQTTDLHDCGARRWMQRVAAMRTIVDAGITRGSPRWLRPCRSDDARNCAARWRILRMV